MRDIPKHFSRGTSGGTSPVARDCRDLLWPLTTVGITPCLALCLQTMWPAVSSYCAPGAPPATHPQGLRPASALARAILVLKDIAWLSLPCRHTPGPVSAPWDLRNCACCHWLGGTSRAGMALGDTYGLALKFWVHSLAVIALRDTHRLWLRTSMGRDCSWGHRGLALPTWGKSPVRETRGAPDLHVYLLHHGRAGGPQLSSGSLAPISPLPCTLVPLSLAPTRTSGMGTAHRVAFQSDTVRMGSLLSLSVPFPFQL